MTLNEEHNIEYCLRSVKPWCDEVIVVDMYSEDRTPEIAQRYADKVVHHERVLGFDAGRHTGFEQATGDWILSIDADEVIPPKLARWIRKFVDSDPPYDIARLPRINVFLGRWMRFTHWWPGKRRLFRPGAIHVTADLHKGLLPDPKARIALLPKEEQLSIWHFSRLSLHVLTSKTNHYTTIEARQSIEAGRGDPRAYEPFLGAARSLSKYVLNRGYRDGIAGLAYAADRAYYKFLVQVKRYDEARAGTRQARYDRWRNQILQGYEEWDVETAEVQAVPVPQNGRNGSRKAVRPLKRLARLVVGGSKK